jgi:regulator of protease activity HflC (stomatin/prohibitin superfamily)
MSDSSTRLNAGVAEREAPHRSGMAIMLLVIALMLAAVALIAVLASSHRALYRAPGIAATAVAAVFLALIGPILLGGLKILKPNEAYVLTLFGKYYGTLQGPGFFHVNPFTSAFNPAQGAIPSTGALTGGPPASGAPSQPNVARRKISLKTLTLSNNKQKINDQLGNPIEIGIVVIWRVVNTAMAVFSVDNYYEYLSIQCDSALRNIVSQYPYDISGNEENERSLRGGSNEIAARLRDEIQDKVALAGLEIVEARITHLAYAPEIAAVMLQRQQAAAIIDARQMIVEGAVGMVEMALARLGDRGIIELDEERKAAMVSNLLVVLCGNKDAQPVVNSGSLY